MKMLHQLSKLRLFVMPATVLLFCSWENTGMYNYSNKVAACNVNTTDTLPKDKQDEFNKAMEELDENMADLNSKMENIKANADKEIKEALSSVDFKTIQEQAEAGLKKVDWNKIQQDVNISLKEAQNEMAKIDFANLQKEMQLMQNKMNSEEFRSQFNSEKLNEKINEAMSRSRESIEKAKENLQQMKAFTDALAADGLIDKKKGYTIEWKNDELYINDQKQPKDIADKYRRYESTGKIKILPEGAERF